MELLKELSKKIGVTGLPIGIAAKVIFAIRDFRVNNSELQGQLVLMEKVHKKLLKSIREEKKKEKKGSEIYMALTNVETLLTRKGNNITDAVGDLTNTLNSVKDKASRDKITTIIQTTKVGGNDKSSVVGKYTTLRKKRASVAKAYAAFVENELQFDLSDEFVSAKRDVIAAKNIDQTFKYMKDNKTLISKYLGSIAGYKNSMFKLLTDSDEMKKFITKISTESDARNSFIRDSREEVERKTSVLSGSIVDMISKHQKDPIGYDIGSMIRDIAGTDNGKGSVMGILRAIIATNANFSNNTVAMNLNANDFITELAGLRSELDLGQTEYDTIIQDMAKVMGVQENDLRAIISGNSDLGKNNAAKEMLLKIVEKAWQADGTISLKGELNRQIDEVKRMGLEKSLTKDLSSEDLATIRQDGESFKNFVDRILKDESEGKRIDLNDIIDKLFMNGKIDTAFSYAIEENSSAILRNIRTGLSVGRSFENMTKEAVKMTRNINASVRDAVTGTEDQLGNYLEEV
ncbi:MAG: hypothetical protein KAI70_01475, partial [Candidatus Omnitrophica bacterium]|nr:hypothetical protein [Candidatus Omnitrophota bacterium]